MTKAKVKRVLERTLEIVSAPGVWGKGHFVTWIPEENPYAAFPGNKRKATSGEYRFCLVGAHQEACKELNVEDQAPGLALIVNCLPKSAERDIVGYNDRRSTRLANIVKVVQCAIDKA